MNKYKLLFGLFLIVFSSHAQKSSFKKEVYVSAQGSLNYQILWPKNFDANKSYPLVLFLHGAGERGSDNEKQLVHGSKLFLDNQDKFPSIVIFPQCPQNDYWANATVNRNTKPFSLEFTTDLAATTAMELLLSLMDSVTSEPFVLKDQVYVMGLSMGGMGTFEILWRRPDLFAAAVAICGGGSTDGAAIYADKVKLRIYHGAKDDVVSPMRSLEMVEALLNAGATPGFTLYEDANHNSWDSTFAEPDLLPWLYSNNKAPGND